jgi:hypothetical protein
VSAGTAAVNKLTTAAASGVIDVDAKTLSNVNSIYVNSTAFTNSIAPISGTSVTMNNADVTGIRNLVVSGDIQVNGDFFVTQTTTCNTDQFMITNDGSGPALIVNQTGYEHIAQFQDDSNVVFFLRDGGQAAFGSFGGAIDTSIPDTQVYIHSLASSNRPALYVQQDSATQNILSLVGTSCNVVVTSDGRLGFGTAEPQARLEILHTSCNVTDVMHLGVEHNPNAFVVGADGRIGIGTTTAGTDATLVIKGVIQADNIVLGGGSGSGSRLITAYGMTAPAGTDTLEFNNMNFSNVDNIYASNVTAYNSVITDKITPQSGTDVSFNFSRVLDIDSLIVRSNINVLISGPSNYQNLPSDLVRIDPDTGRILDSYISSNIVRLMTDTQMINPNLLPAVDTNRKTLMHTKDRVGIGLRNPQQKLHVHGNQCITSGRLGIGTHTPTAVLHVLDNNGPNPTMRVEQQGSMDILQVVGANSTPLLYVNANNSVGVRTSTPDSAYALDVNGKINASESVRTPMLESPTGDIDCMHNNFTNIKDANIHNLTVYNSITLPNGYSFVVNGSNVQAISSSGSSNALIADTFEINNKLTTMYSAINVDGKSLSNVNNLAAVSVTTPTLSGPGANINVSAKTLSNVAAIQVSAITAAGANIDVSAKTLSNVAIAASSVQTDALTAGGANINVSAKTLSNVAAVLATTGQFDSLTASGANINVSAKTLSNVAIAASAVQTSTLTAAGSVIDVSAKTLSNVATLSASTLVGDTLATNAAAYMSMTSGMWVSGYSTSMYDTPTVSLGSNANTTRIGLRVTENIMAQAFLSVSDKRIKTNVVASSPDEDLQMLLNIPVHRFNMSDANMDQRTMVGFIAQEVEDQAPFAVRTTVGAIPSIMRRPTAISADRTVLRVIGHGLCPRKVVKILCDGEDVITTVTETTEDAFAIADALPVCTNILVYGEVVSDFKLLDNERLLPVVFNGVKELHSQITRQQVQIQGILARLSALEKRLE